MRTRTTGFTLIELLIVVAIIGIVAAISIPALTAAIQRARQKRTMAEMRTIAVAVSNYAVDFSFMPKVGPGDAELLEPYLVPTYVRHLPGLDGWSRMVLYDANGLDYTLRSLGSDGLEETGPPLGATTSFADDIVISNGIFVQWPEGMQTN
ncbi:MAG TPA: prepilin-type N-terminal cleavage/methylation domain-containing protein [Thermoanaerobaculaceae bacterium]|nr:prepilin-type N-terminal cleavage/methylation domain-containing protein [Thermoanaerobaculaceae bacterium]